MNSVGSSSGVHGCGPSERSRGAWEGAAHSGLRPEHTLSFQEAR